MQPCPETWGGLRRETQGQRYRLVDPFVLLWCLHGCDQRAVRYRDGVT